MANHAAISKAPEARPSAAALFFRRHFKNKAGVLGLVLLTLVLLTAVLGPMLYPVSPFELLGKKFLPPGGNFLLGTDYLGRDVLAGLIQGARTSLLVGVMAAGMMITIGIIFGALAGFYGGVMDEILMRMTEFFQVLPSFILAMVVVTLFKPTLATIVAAISISTWTGTARILRAEFMSIRERDFVTASRALGSRNARIIFREILPNALPPLIVNASLMMGVAILFEAGLSFLGLADPNVMSWGFMIGSSRLYLRQAWWTVTFPGLAIFVTVLSLSLVGDWLNDFLNPRSRGKQQG
ncbi:MAG TPA: ABC transporter permease [Thermodesulfobacteriota bacterium]|nr:ABC transporter permease [Thermodesulfobacteriota bacterium]